MVSRSALRLRKLRADWIEKNGPCPCGSTENLEVDHIDPTLRISNMPPWYLSKENREKDLENCQVLCRKCHNKKTSRDRSLLTEEEEKEFWELRDAGMGRPSLAKYFGLAESTIQYWLKKRERSS